MRRFLFALALVASVVTLGASEALAQGVTTSSVTGVVTSSVGTPIAGAVISAVHEPSGTRYSGLTRADGRFVIPGMRVGGPYTVTVSSIGFTAQAREGVFLNLGVATDVDFRLTDQALAVEGILVVSESGAIISSDRTGAGTAISRESLRSLPSISGRLNDFVRLTPQASGSSFAGQDNRLNNITVDGSYFNNSFGLGGQPGDRTGVAPISLDAIEQVQVNIAPFDVRQGNFVGAGVNSVTRSGTNTFRGSLRTRYRNEDYVGSSAGDAEVSVGTFRFLDWGGWASGPVIQDKLFFFVNFEKESLTEPGTTFRANQGGEPITGAVTRVLASDLDQLSSFLKNNFGYETGPYQGYDHETPATRFLAKLDYNYNDRNKFSVRYSHLDSFTDVLLSNSASLGFGNRRTNLFGLNYQNSNYQILENIRSVVGEWNATLGNNMANNLIVGYTSHDESRDVRGGDFFPMVDILEQGSVYTTFGYEPFTPSNELRYSSFQLQNNLTRFGVRSTQTFGVSAEFYKSENVFYPGSQSVYSYNSLQDFYTDANDFLANPNRTTSPVQLARFQVRWANVPGQDKPVQPLEVFYAGIYGQNEWRATNDLRITTGLRLDVPFFGETGFTNAQANSYSYRNPAGESVRFATDKLPDANILFSPRLGFNWDLGGTRTTQIRGGTGIFTGRPAYVWISNQIGENGVLTGFQQLNNTTARPFNPDPDAYKPSNVTGDPAASYGLAFTEPSFRFPQLWRSNIAVDQRLPLGLIGTAEFLYAQDVNGVAYYNANLAPANTAFSGADARPRWTTSNRVNSNVTSAVVLKNQDVGTSWSVAGSLERPFSNGLFVKAAYSYGESKNTVNPGSIAFGSWNGNAHAGDPNNPALGYAAGSPGHRVFVASTLTRNFLRVGATTFSLFWEGFTPGRASYTFAGDLNGDGGNANDLIYIPRDISEMNFQTYSASGRTFTAAEQAAAWEAFINQDNYLSKNRGQYAERGGVFLPMRYRTDLSVEQEISRNLGGNQNRLSIRADILNALNLLNSDWGVGQTFVTTQPLLVPTAAQGGAADAQGRAQYRLRNVGGNLITETFRPTAGIGDVWRLQMSLRYAFN